MASYMLKSSDVIYVKSEPSSESFMRRMTLVSAVTGLVTSLLVTYFLVQGDIAESCG